MKKSKLFGACAISILLLSLSVGCDPDEKTPSDLSGLFTAMEKPLETDNFKADETFNFSSQSGLTSFSIPPSALVDEAGNLVTGTVKLEFREIYTKGDMVRYNRPTETKDGRLLESGGEIYIHLTQNDKPLSLAPNKQIRLQMDTDELNYDMDVFYGSVDPTTGLFAWEDDGTPDVPDVALTIDSTNSNGEFFYSLFSDSTDWINCDRFYEIPANQKTTICAKLDDGFTKENTAAYLIYTDRNSVANLYTTNIAELFCSENVPLGNAVTLVSISVKGDKGEEQYYLAHQTTVVTADMEVELSPVATSVRDIEDFLASF